MIRFISRLFRRASAKDRSALDFAERRIAALRVECDKARRNHRDTRAIERQNRCEMTEHKNVYCALAAAQLDMEPVTKDAKNAAFKKPDGSVSRYADLAAVVDAVRPALAKHGLAYFHQMTMFGDQPAMRTVIAHGASDTKIECDVPLIVATNNMQGMKSATTYAKRIGLESVTGVAPEDDDGNAAVKAAPKAVAPLTDAWKDGVLDGLPESATPAQKAEAFATAICADFADKGSKALENRWARHEPMIKTFQDRYPDLYGMVIDAYETRRNDLQESAA